MTPVQRVLASHRHGKTRWLRTGKNGVPPCSHCGGDRCMVSPDGVMGHCHRQNVGFRTDGANIPPPMAPIPPIEREPDPIAPDEVLDQIYAPFFRDAGLSDEHRAALAARGFAPEHVGRLVAASTGTLAYRKALAVAAREAHEAGKVTVPLPSTAERPGIVLGVRDREGRIVGVVTRLDDPGPGGKYRWALHSKARVHVAVPSGLVIDTRVWITEGVFKAEIAATRLGAVVLALPGVSGTAAHHEASVLVGELGGTEAVIAYDADLTTNPHVALGHDMLASALAGAGWRVSDAYWPLAAGKGLDDLLVGGGAPVVAPFDPASVIPAAAEARGVDWRDWGVPPGQRPKLLSPAERAKAGLDPIDRREPRFPNYVERTILARAAWFAPNATTRKGLLAAAICGVFHERRECAAHSVQEGRDRVLVCERPGCMHFAFAHARDQLKVIGRPGRWPKEVAIGVLAAPDDPDGVCALRGAVRKALAKLVRKAAKANGATAAAARAEAKAAVSRIGFYVSPGALAVVSVEPEDAVALRQIRGLENTDRAGRKRLLERLEPIVYARAERLIARIDACDMRALGQDPWCDRVVTPTGGVAFRKLAGWPTMEELREEASPHPKRLTESETENGEPRSEHCNGDVRFMLIHAPTGQPYGSRIGKPWTYPEVVKLADATEKAIALADPDDNPGG